MVKKYNLAKMSSYDHVCRYVWKIFISFRYDLAFEQLY